MSRDDATTGNASTSSSNDPGAPGHTYSLDVLGRQTLDAVTTLGTGVDGTIRAIGTNYNSQGLPYQQTDYSNGNGTGVVNQVQDVYNGLGQLTGEYQAHSGSVNTSTTPEVQYAYSDPSLGSRMTSMTYPNGRQVDYVYNTGIDTAIGRVSGISDDAGSAAGNLQSYSYQGVGTIVGMTDGNGVTETTTLDGFGRAGELKYVNGNSTTTDDFAYGYDRDGDVLYKNNLLQSNQSELYHANSSTSGDNNSAYDGLDRLTAFKRGTLSSSGNNGSTLDTVSSASSSQSWSLNAVGDQSSVTTGNTTTTNTTNAKNELTANGSNSLTYDNNGNTLTDESGQTYTYDGWNREVTVKNSGNTTIATFGYDPTGRRITETSGNTTTDVYFSNQWQSIEERQGGNVTRQNVWGEGYVNQLVERDDNSTSGSLGKTSSGLGRRLYAQQDANWNVTSLVNSGGTVVERMTYLPYGAVTFLTASWGSTTDSYNQNALFQGGRLETATGQYLFDFRDYDPTTGTWKEVDPAQYVNGPDRYQLEMSNPGSKIDPVGLGVGLTSSGSTPDNEINSGSDAINWFVMGSGQAAYLSNAMISNIQALGAYEDVLAGIAAQVLANLPPFASIGGQAGQVSGSTEIGPGLVPALIIGAGSLPLTYTAKYHVSSTALDANGQFTVSTGPIAVHVVLDKQYTFQNKVGAVSKVANGIAQILLGKGLGGKAFRIHNEWNETLAGVSQTFCTKSGRTVPVLPPAPPPASEDDD